jgi:hypothetical protein
MKKSDNPRKTIAGMLLLILGEEKEESISREVEE